MISLTKNQWGAIFGLPSTILKKEVLDSRVAYKELIQEWIKGRVLEVRVAGNDNNKWRVVKEGEALSFTSGSEYRVKESVKLSIELSHEEAIAFYDDLYENNHRTMNSITARDKIMKGIDKELRDKWGK